VGLLEFDLYAFTSEKYPGCIAKGALAKPTGQFVYLLIGPFRFMVK
jgi:hypothetical protein